MNTRRPAAASDVASTRSSRLGLASIGLLEAGWLAALAITPLFFNPRSARVFEPEKISWIIALALLAGWPYSVAIVSLGAALYAAQRLGMRAWRERRAPLAPIGALVLGVGLAGPHAAEMIAEGCLALEMGAELTDLAETLHPHPTMSELLSDAARDADRGGAVLIGPTGTGGRMGAGHQPGVAVGVRGKDQGRGRHRRHRSGCDRR